MINNKIVVACGIISVSALASMTANAANAVDNNFSANDITPFYVSGQAGYVGTHLSENNEGPMTNNDGLAYRLAAGYNINKYFAIETGYFRINSHTVNSISDQPFDISVNQNAIDILGKVSVPVSNNVSIYGKVGAAYLVTDISDNIDDTVNFNSSKHTIAPEVAGGISFDISKDMAVDASLTHIQPMASRKIGNIDYLSVGFKYNFG